MNALVLTAQGQGPVCLDRQPPTPAPGEVQVVIAAAALNHRDLWIRAGRYPGIRHPIVLGSDGVGTICAVGEGISEARIGARVILNPSLDWGPDERQNQPKFTILGLPRDGTFAEVMTIPSANALPCPTHLSDPCAAALPLAGLTAWRALVTRGEAKAGDRVLITGIGGGVALAALQWAVALGCEVWVTSSRAEKIQRAVALGASGGVLYTDEGWERGLLSQARGAFDVVIDSAGGDGFKALTRVVGLGGRIVFYGATCGKWPPLSPQLLFFKQVSVLATMMGSDQDFTRMLDFVSRRRLEPVVDRIFELADGAAAFDWLESGAQFGKVVLRIGDS